MNKFEIIQLKEQLQNDAKLWSLLFEGTHHAFTVLIIANQYIGNPAEAEQLLRIGSVSEHIIDPDQRSSNTNRTHAP